MNTLPTTSKKKKSKSTNEARDFAIVHRINEHYHDLYIEIQTVDSLSSFVNSKNQRKVILFDFLQIGELMNQLSDPFLLAFNNKHAYDLITMRNRVVHGYNALRDDIVFNTLKYELSSFMNELNTFSLSYYKKKVRALLGKTITVIIDRPKGTIHNDITYLVDYGYTEALTALDGEFQDAYIIGDNDGRKIVGKVIAIIDREDDIESKLVVTTNNTDLSEEEIEKELFFQEQFFIHKIIK